MIIQVRTGKPCRRFIFVRFRFSLLSVCLLLVASVATFIWLSNLCELQKLIRKSKDVKMVSKIEGAKNCYRSNNEKVFDDLELLEDVLQAEYKPKLGRSIFFHETSCTRDGICLLNAR